MIKKTNTRLVVAAVSLAVLGSLAAPQALAHKRHKSHHHATKSYRQSGSSEINSKVDALEAQLRAMQDEISSLRAGGAGAAAPADAAKVQELDQWMASVKSEPVKAKSKDNMVFFRGGYAHFDNVRGGTLDPTSVSALGLANRNGTLVGPITDRDAWYFGAGFDFSLDDNLWGLMDNTEVLAELGVNYSQLATKKNNGLSPQETATILAATEIGLPAANTETATVNMATVSAAPKIKFLKGSAFRPWLIPVGFELNVISPPSDAITVLTPGMVFGVGADYKIWKNLYVGADVRYHYAPGDIDGVRINALNAGGYLGIGF